MSKFCSNCGNQIDEKAVICVKCGVAINNIAQTSVTQTQAGKGTGIASMVLGIFATLNSICSIFIFICLLASGEYFLPYEKLVFGFVFLMIPVTLLILGIALGFNSRSKIKNGINLTGVLLNFISLTLCILSIFIIYLI